MRPVFFFFWREVEVLRERERELEIGGDRLLRPFALRRLFETKLPLRGSLTKPQFLAIAKGSIGQTSVEQETGKNEARERSESGKQEKKLPLVSSSRLLRGSQCPLFSLSPFFSLRRFQLPLLPPSPAVSEPCRRRRVLGDHERALLLFGRRIGRWRGKCCDEQEEENNDNRRGKGDTRRANQQSSLLLVLLLLPPPPPRWPLSSAVAWHRYEARITIFNLSILVEAVKDELLLRERETRAVRALFLTSFASERGRGIEKLFAHTHKKTKRKERRKSNDAACCQSFRGGSGGPGRPRSAPGRWGHARVQPPCSPGKRFRNRSTKRSGRTRCIFRMTSGGGGGG